VVRPAPGNRYSVIVKFKHSDTVHAICEEFRAAATLDYKQDEQDRGNREIAFSAVQGD
jgi:haloacetate dehalogenase